MPPAGCRWARGRSADVIEVGIFGAPVKGLEVGGVGYFDFKCISMARLSISSPFRKMVRSS